MVCVFPAGAWSPKRAPIMTKWAAQVDPKLPWPDYPRPQLVRKDWLNLNGIWEFQAGTPDDPVPAGQELTGEILVPYPIESALSGVMEAHDRGWYRRKFTVPAGWAGQNVKLNFGAVDYEAEVFVNGKSVGVHRGGYDPFSFDITPFLKGSGDQELIVRVFDPTNQAGYPRGKQTSNPEGIMYTSTTGIWQTVWLEPVAPISIANLQIVPDVDGGKVRVRVNTAGAPAGITARVVARDDGKVIGSVEGKADGDLEIPIPNAKLWSPESPHLYDLEVQLLKDGKIVDSVTSYFGMRKIQIADVDGKKKILLNGKFEFQIGPLDQGFWPDGIYTPPTEAALKADIQTMKDLGFNMVRKHIKVEPARWYYWTDKLGLLVWQDMPSANSYQGKINPRPPVDTAAFERELRAMIANLGNTPSIIMWVIFNEGQGQHDTGQLVDLVHQLDPTRLVNEASGGKIFGFGDIADIHAYPAPKCPPPSSTQALVCGEYGGIGFKVPDHMWFVDRGGGYTNAASAEDLVNLYAEFIEKIRRFRDEQGLSAAVYTELTDVMTEINGMMTYDRVLKVPAAEIARANHFAFPAPTYRTVIPTSDEKPEPWRYTTTKPAHEWSAPDFDDSKWTEGLPLFGKLKGKGTTPWATPDIWMRRTFNPGPLTAEQIASLVIKEVHDDEVQVFINGVPAFDAHHPVESYEYRGLSAAARQAVKPGAENVIAVHCLTRGGGQCVDIGLSERIPGK